MAQVLFLIAVIVPFFVVAAIVDGRRRKSLQAWVERHPGATLHWGFDPAKFPQFPAVELGTRLIGRPLPVWAAALETESVWLVEISFTRQAGKTSEWHVMIATRQADGNWQPELLKGLLTTALLEKADSDISS